MSANHTIDVYGLSRGQSPMRRIQDDARLFHSNRDTVIGPEVSASLPVRMLHWPSRLFLDAHPIADGDRLYGVLGTGDGRPACSRACSEMGGLLHRLINGNTQVGVAP